MLRDVPNYKGADLKPGLLPTAYATIAFCLVHAAYGDTRPERSAPILALARTALDLSFQARGAISRDSESPIGQQSSEGFDNIDTAANTGNTVGRAREAALRSVAAAHLGDWDVARKCMTQALFVNLSANSDDYPKADLHLLLQYRQLLESANRLHDLVDIILIIPSQLNEPLLAENDADPHMPLFCEVFYSALAGINRPMEWFSATVGWSDETRRTAALLFTVLTRYQSRSQEALAVCEQLYTTGLYIPLDASARLCGTLVRFKQFDEALTLYRFTRERNRNVSHLFFSNTMAAFVEADLLDKADEIYHEITSRYTPSWRDRAIVPIRLSQLGKPKETLQIIRANFGPDWGKDIEVVKIMNRAYISANDPEGSERLLKRMLELAPDNVPSYNAIIKLYADRGDVRQSIRKFHDLLDAGLTPTVQTFRIIIRMFANRNDLANVGLLLETMARCNIDPDAQVSAAVIKAHVNCGEWQGAARVFDSLPDYIRFSPQVSSAILRAYIMLSVSPAAVVSAFEKIRDPTAQHWSMLILSYCDAGLMVEAARAFQAMDQRSRGNVEAPVPNLYTFSIFIYGCLRNNDGKSAETAFQEMIKRRIVPSSVTYGTVIQSYLSAARPLSNARLQTVHQFAMSVYALAKQDGLGDQAGSQVDTVANLFRGMIRAAGDIDDADAAQAYHDVASKRPGGPDLQMVNQLMSTYRKQGNVQMVMQLWKQAVVMAQDLRGASESSASTANGQSNRLRIKLSAPSNLLCISLSIAMETLGNAGEYNLLKNVWNEVRMEGFGFDSNNFNTYAIALVKTGDIEGAFYVFDKVLMPRWRAALERRNGVLAQQDGESQENSDPTIDASRASSGDSDASDLAEDVDVPDAKTAQSMPLPQKMSALLYNKYQSDDEPSYDPALWGGAKDFAKESLPTASATIPPSTQFGALPVSRGSAGRSLALKDSSRSEIPIMNSDTPSRILSKFDSTDPLWRPSWDLLEVLSSAYAEIQRQRKMLSDEVETVRQQISDEYEAAKQTMGVQVPGRFDMGGLLPDESDPRRKPRFMELPQFNGSPVRDRFGIPMQSTPVVVLWRLNAIYPGVVKEIYRYRRTAGMTKVSDELSDANLKIAKAKRKDDAFIALTTKRISGEKTLSQEGASSLAELEKQFAARRERMRQYLLSRVSVPRILDKERTSGSFGIAPQTIDERRRTQIPDVDRELLDDVYNARLQEQKDRDGDIQRMSWKEKRADRSLQDPELRPEPAQISQTKSKPRAVKSRSTLANYGTDGLPSEKRQDVKTGPGSKSPQMRKSKKGQDIKTFPGSISPALLGRSRTDVSSAAAPRQSWNVRLASVASASNSPFVVQPESEDNESMDDFANELIERRRRVERRSMARFRDKMVDADARFAAAEAAGGEGSHEMGEPQISLMSSCP